jgi:hypothetical protein
MSVSPSLITPPTPSLLPPRRRGVPVLRPPRRPSLSPLCSGGGAREAAGGAWRVRRRRCVARGGAALEELRRWEAQIDGAPALRWSGSGGPPSSSLTPVPVLHMCWQLLRPYAAGASCCRQLLPPGCGGGDGSTDGATEVGCVDEVVLSPAPRREMGWVPRRRGASTAVVGPTEDGGGSRVPLDLEDTRGILLFPVSFQDTAAAHIPSSLSSRRLSRVPVRMV